MIYYWILFIVPLVGVFSPVKLSGIPRLCSWLLVAFATSIFIGFRYEIGGDWENYLDYFLRMEREGMEFLVSSGRSTGYGVINWFSAKLGWGISGVNTICGVVFVAGLTYFCRRQPMSWLAWTVAVPYLVVVVGMGYTRQSVAIGFLMFSYVFLTDRRGWLFAISV